jgi:hypothetical protein
MEQNDFPGITIIESNMLKRGMGICLPPFGIVVYRGASLALKQHEYGHFLQYRQMGFLRFYLVVGLPSLWSAVFFPENHFNLKVEKDANKRASAFFGEDAPISNVLFWPK